jgi:hypothetical protein
MFLYKVLRIFGIETITPMIISSSDQFQLIEVAVNGITTHEPCTLAQVRDLVLKYYGEQPLKYFNENRRLKVVHLKTGSVKDVTLDVSSF